MSACCPCNPDEQIPDYFKDVVYLIEATDYERLCLWRDNDTCTHTSKMKWEEVSMGYWFQIGELDNRPVNLTLCYAILDGKKVAFYESCSQVVDWKMIEDYLSKLNLPKTNAMNFHHCIHFIKGYK